MGDGIRSDKQLSSMSSMALFLSPIQRSASAVLDKALFSKTIPIAAARVADKKLISRCRAELNKSRELLRLERMHSVRDDPDPTFASRGGKCLLLQPEVKVDDPKTWSSILQQAVDAQHLRVIPYNLQIDYDYWTYHDIMKAILPEESQDEIPVGFNVAGHVAHLNLRKQHLPSKKLIAQVLLDKTEGIKTVINKTDMVGTESEYRTFGYEVLAGEDDMNVEVREENCIFCFDYSNVYWNSRLQTEHRRLVGMFNPGEVVCDVMAGVGPFAVPAGKKGVIVWANDLNPYSYASLKDSIRRNNVDLFVRPFCEDGHTFIHQAVADLLNLAAAGSNQITISKKQSRTAQNRAKSPQRSIIKIPPTFSHFVMNLPASAISFLPSYKGLYAQRETMFTPHTTTKLPMIHVHCFSTKSDDNVQEGLDICDRISKELGVTMIPGDGETEGEVTIHDVRDVAPQKRMFCASFRLPKEVAFATS